MTVTSGFFNSVDGDRKYDAEDFGRIFSGMIEDGIFKGIGTDFQVTATSGLSLAVGAGRAFFNDVWVNNDDVEGVVGSAAHSGLPRVDAVIIEVDKSTAVRRASIKYKAGSAANPAFPPEMVHTEELDQYPLAYVNRAASSTSITNSNIRNLVGTPDCPYAVSRLLDRSFDNAASHRKIFRGNNLGDSFTSAQKLAIRQGTFEDLFIGDYWRINKVNWRIVDLDYFYNFGSPATKKHHVTIMPDTPLAFGNMNNDYYKYNAGAYVGSDARTRMNAMRLKAEAAFGGISFILQQPTILTNSLANGKPNNSATYNVHLELPSIDMIFGTNTLQLGGDGSTVPPRQSTESARQFSLFDLAPWFIRTANDASVGGDQNVASTSWLRDVLSPAMWGMIGMGGELTFGQSNSQYFYRPYFSIVGA